MQIEELPYYRKDEDAYLKIPGDNDDLENTFLPASPKKKVNKIQHVALSFSLDISCIKQAKKN